MSFIIQVPYTPAKRTITDPLDKNTTFSIRDNGEIIIDHEIGGIYTFRFNPSSNKYTLIHQETFLGDIENKSMEDFGEFESDCIEFKLVSPALSEDSSLWRLCYALKHNLTYERKDITANLGLENSSERTISVGLGHSCQTRYKYYIDSLSYVDLLLQIDSNSKNATVSCAYNEFGKSMPVYHEISFYEFLKKAQGFDPTILKKQLIIASENDIDISTLPKELRDFSVVSRDVK